MEVSTIATLEREEVGVPPKPYTAPLRQIWGWAVGRVAEFGLINTYGQAMNIFTVGFGLSPVIVSWCMMLPRLIDGLLDPVIGHWSDNTHTRWGRRKPFMIGGAFLGAVFLSILWWASPTWSPTAQFVYLGIIGTCVYLCYGAYQMAWTAIGYELSDDYHERSKVAAIGGFVLAAMALLGSWIYWLALRPVFGNVIWGMRWIGAGMALLIVASAIATTLLTKERFTRANRTHVKLFPAIRSTLKNKAFVYLLLMKVFEIFGGRLAGGISFYLGVYYVCQGDQERSTRLAGIGATLGMIWNFAMLPLVKPASKLIGKRGALISSTCIGFATSLVAPFITTPAHPWWGLIPGLIVAPLLVITGTIAGAILPDICDVDELENGQRREGLFTAVMGFVGKLEISLAVVLVGYIVTAASVDTKIGLRWQGMIDGKPDAITGFVAGESGVFRLSVPRSANHVQISDDIGEVEILVSDTSPTEGFRSIGTFRGPSSFPATTGTYWKLRLGRSAPIDEVHLTGDDSATNLLAASAGTKMVAAQPPTAVVNKLYWLVMIPAILFSGLTLVMTILFPLSEARMKDVRRQLDAIRLAKAEVGIPTDEVAEERVRG